MHNMGVVCTEGANKLAKEQIFNNRGCPIITAYELDNMGKGCITMFRNLVAIVAMMAISLISTY